MTSTELSKTLKILRQAKRISQLELSLRLDVSQRHISFVEQGKSKPSRKLLIAWLQELETPPLVCNESMLAAGYAPVYQQSNLEAPELTLVRQSLQQLLSAHDPVPAMILDTDWNVIQFNRGGQWLARTLMPWLEEMKDQGDLNILDLLCLPEGFTKAIQNLLETRSGQLLGLLHQTPPNQPPPTRPPPVPPHSTSKLHHSIQHDGSL